MTPFETTGILKHGVPSNFYMKLGLRDSEQTVDPTDEHYEQCIDEAMAIRKEIEEAYSEEKTVDVVAT